MSLFRLRLFFKVFSILIGDLFIPQSLKNGWAPAKSEDRLQLSDDWDCLTWAPHCTISACHPISALYHGGDGDERVQFELPVVSVINPQDTKHDSRSQEVPMDFEV